jgi:hypothetical protein
MNCVLRVCVFADKNETSVVQQDAGIQQRSDIWLMWPFGES